MDLTKNTIGEPDPEDQAAPKMDAGEDAQPEPIRQRVERRVEEGGVAGAVAEGALDVAEGAVEIASIGVDGAGGLGTMFADGFGAVLEGAGTVGGAIVDGLGTVGGAVVDGLGVVGNVAGEAVGAVAEVGGSALEGMGGCAEGCAGCSAVIVLGALPVVGLLGWLGATILA